MRISARLVFLFCLIGLPLNLAAQDLLKQVDELDRLASLNSYQRCINLLEAAVQTQPDSFELTWRLARPHSNYPERPAARNEPAWQAASQTHGRAALNAATRAVRLKPRAVQGHYWSAQAIASLSLSRDTVTLIKQGLLAARGTSLEKACRIDRKYAGSAPLMALAEFCSQAPRVMGGNPARAEDLAREALRDYPKSPAAQLNLATVLLARAKAQNLPEIKAILKPLLASQHGDPAYTELVSLKSRRLAALL